MTDAKQIKNSEQQSPEEIPSETPNDIKGNETPNDIFSEKQPIIGNVEDIADGLIGEMPPVNEEILREISGDQKFSAPKDGPRDGKGHVFDPEIHRVDDNGKPKINASGNFVRRRTSKKSQSFVGKSTVNIQESDAKDLALYRATGVTCANTLIHICTIVGGEDFQPTIDKKIGLDEKLEMERAFIEYASAKDLKDFPPGIALSLVISAYILPRFTMPRTRTRLSAFKAWIKKRVMRTKK